ncbi:MAG TPA: type II toxin-antitoxin system HicA family toxin [bacterium]|nr:type II toxin-antitoxin system HicA family toxin [bacterium]
MTRLPVVSDQETIAAFRKCGYEIDHQTGGHIILRNSKQPHRRLTIPNHKDIAKGTLRSLIRQAGLTVEEFARLLS